MKIKGKKILITGATGLVGVNLSGRLQELGADVFACGNTRGILRYDLTQSAEAELLFEIARPEIVIHLAARVGGIHANMNAKAQFYEENAAINTNVIAEARGCRVEYIMAMGTGCAYPKRLEGHELSEEDYLEGAPEPTNDAYAYAKRGMLAHLAAAGEQDGLRYSYVIPANIYGPGDNFHPLNSHVVPALVRRFVEAKKTNAAEVIIWGDGAAYRDFLYIDDLTDAMLLILENRFSGAVNVATGAPAGIQELAETIAELADYRGEIIFDPQKPAGQSIRLFNTEKIRALGFAPSRDLRAGLAATIAWYEKNYKGAKNAAAVC